MTNYYEILQVKNFAEDEVVKASYRALSKKYHPDLNKDVSPDIMAEINNAFSVLSDPVKKNNYDRELENHLRAQHTRSTEFHFKNNESTFDDDSIYQGTAASIVAIGVRTILSIIITLIVGYLGNLLLMGILDSDGTWSFLLYIVYGSILGSVIKLISGHESRLLGVIGGIVCTITLVLPYFEFLTETLLLYNGGVYDSNLIIRAIEELFDYFFGYGLVRAGAIIFTPVATFSAISE